MKFILQVSPLILGFRGFLSGLVAVGSLSAVLVPVTARAAAKDVCAVFTAADAQGVLGEPVGPAKGGPQTTGFGDGSVCRYKSTVGKAFQAKTISVTLQYSSSTDLTGYASQIAQTEKTEGYANVHMVPGVGSSAIWGTLTTLGRPQGELTVIKGKAVMLVVLIIGMDEATALEKAKGVALQILPKT